VAERLRQHIIPIGFAIAAYIILLCNADYLFSLEEESLFVPGRTFMKEIMTEHDGLWTWIGCWLTQFFYHPWLGSLIIVIMWVASYYCITYSTGWKGWITILAILPQCALLYLLLCLGYWIYYIKSPGYAFTPTMVLLWASILTAVSSFVLRRFVKCSRWWYACILFGIFLFAAQPRFRIYSISLPDARLKNEMRMYTAIEECRWDDVMEEFRKTGQPTNLMVMYKNIALMHSGRMLDMFKTGNCGVLPPEPVDIMTGDTLRLRTSRLGAKLIYYEFGQLNYAYRWAMCNAVEYGMNVRDLKIMVRCALMNQEFPLAARYLALLESTMFHREWALEQGKQMMSNTLLMQSRDFQNIAPLMVDEGNSLDYDDGLCEQWLLFHFSDLVHIANPKLEEVIMTTALWTKDAYSYPIHFYRFVNGHPNDPIPHLYQEAAILLCTMESSPVQLDNFPFDQIVSDRYNNFVKDYNQLAVLRLSDAETAERLKSVYGDTYWWYFYFYNDFKIY